jgi:hypothetical protein
MNLYIDLLLYVGYNSAESEALVKTIIVIWFYYLIMQAWFLSYVSLCVLDMKGQAQLYWHNLAMWQICGVSCGLFLMV